MPYLSVSLDLDGIDPVEAEEAFFVAGALSVTLTDRRDDAILEPAPGEVLLWPATRLSATFEATRASPALLVGLAAAIGVEVDQLEVATVGDRVWEREWLRDFHAMRFGRRLHVCPTHERIEDADAVVVTLDPGLAFGTGTHPTTALCLEWLDSHLRAGERVLDYGCGSGILAIAALLLGAASADAFDIDPQALIATRDNAARNGVADRLHIHDEPPRGITVDIVLANILSGPLIELAPLLARLVRPGGSILLAGLMETQSDDVLDAYRPWFALAAVAQRDAWVALAGRRREG
jgi:ribosomal protein L11 methyltransferase